MVLAKACHDLDILHWNVGPIRRVHSFGALTYFTSANAPDGATERCTDGCPAAATCPFDARRFYLGDYVGWPVSTISDDGSLEARLEALRSGPYGRCVFRSDNDVVDHQVVSMETTTGATVTLTVHGHGHEDARTFRYDGSRATLRGVFGMVSSSLELHDHLSGERHMVDVPIRVGGHGGGDDGAIDEFLRAVHGAPDAPRVVDVRDSHYLAFAAEVSRRSGNVVDLAQS
jgi:predicted dehydrogenase